MASPVQSCRAEDTLARAAQLMWDHDCRSLPVCGGDGVTRVVGVITDRDICMCALFQNKPLQQLRVSEAMAKQVQLCRPGDSLAEAERTMREARIRRLPVVNEEDALVGMISLADLRKKPRESALQRRRKSPRPRSAIRWRQFARHFTDNSRHEES